MKIYTVVHESEDYGSIEAIASFKNSWRAINKMVSEFSKRTSDIENIDALDFTFGSENSNTPYIGLYNGYWDIWRVLESEMGDE